MKYHKKPPVTEAIQFKDDVETIKKVCEFIKDIEKKSVELSYKKPNPCFLIETSEGMMKAEVGDYIVKGDRGGLYACSADLFGATYEKVEEPEKT